MKPIPANTRKLHWQLPMMYLMDTPLRPAAQAFCRLRAKLRRYTPVNPLGKGESHVSLSFLAHPTEEKSDGFLLTARTDKELEVWISDGGFATGDTLSAVLKLREELLRKAGLEKEIPNPRYKLEYSLLISHFHIDHVNETNFRILPCHRFLQLKKAYYPHISAYVNDQSHDITKNGDVGHRTRFHYAVSAYHPLSEMHELAFGETRRIPFGNGTITLMMPDRDWGAPENVQRIAQMYNYSAMTVEKRREAAPVQTINSNCVVARIEYASRSMLLTGDAMKRTYEYTDEPFDLLVGQNEQLMRADIIKYPHHGQGRTPAWPIIKEKMLLSSPEAMVVLTGHKGHAQAGELLTQNNVPWMDLREGTLRFTITEDGKIRRERL